MPAPGAYALAASRQLFEDSLELLDRQQFAQAEQLLRRALQLTPGRASLCCNLGLALLGQHRLTEAVTWSQAALAAAPDLVAAWVNLGRARELAGDPVAAGAAYQQALAIDPQHAEAGHNLLELCTARAADARSQRHFADALAYTEQALALALRPDAPELLANRALLLRDLHRHAEALDAIAAALALQPAQCDLLANRATILLEAGETSLARADLLAARAQAPDHAGIEHSLGMLELALGNQREGWRHYQARLRLPEFRAQDPAPGLAEWDGLSALDGRHLLVHSEQGLGDTLQFLRLLHALPAEPLTITLRVQPELQRLCARHFPGLNVQSNGAPLPPADLKCALLSLPACLDLGGRLSLDGAPYLSADPQRRSAWRLRLDRPGRLQVGLAWAVNPRHHNDHRRSIALAELLAALPSGPDYHVLQTHIPAGDREALAGSGLIVHALTPADFEDVAALTSLMDVVVSVDTALAHLAGGLGVPLLLLLPFRADFRWLERRQDSPWYASAQLLRQLRPGDWRAVLTRLAALLEHWPPP